MFKKLLTVLLVVLSFSFLNTVNAQNTAYVFNAGPFSYGTIDLTTAAFTSMNFLPQGSSYYPVAGDNVTESDQYAIMADFGFPANYYLWHIDFVAMTGDSIAPVGPLASGQSQIKAFARDNSTDSWYMISTDDFGSVAVLYTVDINTGTATEVATIQNATFPVAMVIDCDGNAYIVNSEGLITTTAVLYSLNLNTAVATQVGTNLGFDNVFGGGQDMDYNPGDGKYYWSAYWSDGFFNEGGSFREVDVVNGTSTELGVFGQFENLTGMSVALGCSTVPVELTSFTANVNGKNVVLNWSTATELNNSGFEVERQNTGSEWQKVGFVPGFGTTTEQHSYSFTDSELGEGTYSYRIKQVDYDGSFEYSDVVNVDVTAPAEFNLAQNYPNPFNPSTFISFTIPKETQVKLSVYNTLGEEVAVLVNNVQTAGTHTFEFSANNFASGTYFYRLEAGSFVSVKKMILMK